MSDFAKNYAEYASFPEQSRGRLFREEESQTRTVFQRDRDRIVHCGAFRKLEYKTQVFVNHEGDYYRTRLTHSIEVAQITRTICRELGLNEDLAEALALAHDLGHTPFGHAGEEALGEAMLDFGGFDHNAQTIRILTKLEERYANFDGLNLTWEALEGIAKHNGPLIKKTADKSAKQSILPRAIAEYNEIHDLELHTMPSAEAQVASLADDIAYNNHDIDDGLRAGLFVVDQLMSLPLVGSIFKSVYDSHKGMDNSRLVHESVRRIINMMVVDLLKETRKLAGKHKPKSAQDVRMLGGALVAFSAEMQEYNHHLKDFLRNNMYKHYRVNRMCSKARRIIKDMFTLFLNEPECLPTEWRKRTDGKKSQQTAELVCDFIAGMTDRFAIDEHRRLFDVSSRS